MIIVAVLAVITVFVGIISYAAYTDVLFGNYYPLYREAYGRDEDKIDSGDYVGFLTSIYKKAGGRLDADDYIAI